MRGRHRVEKCYPCPAMPSNFTPASYWPWSSGSSPVSPSRGPSSVEQRRSELVAQGQSQRRDEAVQVGTTAVWAWPALDVCFQVECVHRVAVTHPLAAAGQRGRRGYPRTCVCV